MNMGTCAHTHELMVFCSLSQVSAHSPRKMENLIFMKAECQLRVVGFLKWAESTFGPLQKSQLGEHELEPLRKILHNLVRLPPFPFHASLLKLRTYRTSQYKH